MSESRISTTAAADRIGVSRSTVARWLKLGLLPGVRVGNAYKINPADLDLMVRDAVGA
jgi:excisionase family DNA binding protein